MARLAAVLAGLVVLAVGCRKGKADAGALLDAACRGDAAKCEQLVSGGVPVDAADQQGDTALDWAVYCCSIDVVKKLIQLGADVNHIDRRGGFTPLMYTATTLRGHFLKGTQKERAEIAAVLIAHGADVNRAVGDGRSSGDGQTALHFAATDGNAGLVRMLLAAGANRTAKDSHGWTPLDMAKFPDYAPNQEVVRELEDQSVEWGRK